MNLGQLISEASHEDLHLPFLGLLGLFDGVYRLGNLHSSALISNILCGCGSSVPLSLGMLHFQACEESSLQFEGPFTEEKGLFY